MNESIISIAASGSSRVFLTDPQSFPPCSIYQKKNFLNILLLHTAVSQMNNMPITKLLVTSDVHMRKLSINSVLAGSVVYLGMMVGAFFWGGMSDKVGRRQCLLICMSTNGFFAFLSSFVQGYGLFLLCRLVAGFG